MRLVNWVELVWYWRSPKSWGWRWDWSDHCIQPFDPLLLPDRPQQPDQRRYRRRGQAIEAARRALAKVFDREPESITVGDPDDLLWVFGQRFRDRR